VYSNRGDAVPDFPSQSFENLPAKWSGGDGKALQAFVALVDNELHGLAQPHLRGERPGHTLQGTALFNEAYLRLVEQGPFQTNDRRHLVAVANTLNSQILVDCVRPHRATVKRDWSMAQTWLSRRRKGGDGGNKTGMGKN